MPGVAKDTPLCNLCRAADRDLWTVAWRQVSSCYLVPNHQLADLSVNKESAYIHHIYLYKALELREEEYKLKRHQELLDVYSGSDELPITQALAEGRIGLKPALHVPRSPYDFDSGVDATPNWLPRLYKQLLGAKDVAVRKIDDYMKYYEKLLSMETTFDSELSSYSKSRGHPWRADDYESLGKQCLYEFAAEHRVGYESCILTWREALAADVKSFNAFWTFLEEIMDEVDRS